MRRTFSAIVLLWRRTKKEWRRGGQKFHPNRVEIVEVELGDDGKEVARSIVCRVNANHPDHDKWIERLLGASALDKLT